MSLLLALVLNILDSQESQSGLQTKRPPVTCHEMERIRPKTPITFSVLHDYSKLKLGSDSRSVSVPPGRKGVQIGGRC